MDPYTIILADNHPPLREGLRRIIGEQPDLEITGEAGEVLEFLNLLASRITGPHLVILDLSLPNLEIGKAVGKIKALHPETKVLILSMHEDVEYLRQALSSGAEGYLIKERVDKELLRAIETIRRGKLYVPPALEAMVPPWFLSKPFEER